MFATTALCLMGAQPVPQDFQDLDHDGIPDEIERRLAAKYPPILILDRSGAYAPVNICEVLSCTSLESVDQSGVFKLKGTSLTNLIDFLRQDIGTRNLKLYSPPTAWRSYRPRSGSLPHLFWRVSKLSTNAFSLQYYWFCTFSDADFPFDVGDHDGDWLSIDLTILNDRPQERVSAVIFHNHGRQLFPSPDQCEWQAERILVYPEYQSNEPWPVPAKGPVASIPTNKRYGSAVVRSHLGKGPSVKEWLLVPLGERRFPGSSTAATIVMKFKGYWGKNAGWGTDSPRGPSEQGKMWDRDFSTKHDRH